MNALPTLKFLDRDADRITGRNWLLVNSSGVGYAGKAIAVRTNPVRITLENAYEIIFPADRVFSWQRVARHGLPVKGESSVGTYVYQGNVEIKKISIFLAVPDRVMQQFQDYS